MSDAVNELYVAVGSVITASPEEDREAYEEDKQFFEEVQDLLREEGIDFDLLAQPGTAVWEDGTINVYDLYQLQYLAAHLEAGDDIEQLVSEQSIDGVEFDELLADILEDEKSTRFPHLIKHHGEGGYYLPVDFDEPLHIAPVDDVDDMDDLNGDDLGEEEMASSFGSSTRLMRELTEVETLFQQARVPQVGARDALGVLKTAAQLSMDTGLPIIIW